MIVELPGWARCADAAIERRMGPAYHAVLGIGLVVEIVRRLRDGPHLDSARGIGSIVAIVLFGVLLLHQLAELGERLQHRRP